ncbi:hypothetical protein [Bartonella machadoae]|uniref:hypothetical protein n=1 Tax=Bartonella machadoae TaxID=2893471 RepID=UPI001F4CF2C2|nr:hypothetical protein [Bartonella machadoae]UNE53958.1 hypothetical protein LNM86_10305 [Bartonella machadoae]
MMKYRRKKTFPASVIKYNFSSVVKRFSSVVERKAMLLFFYGCLAGWAKMLAAFLATFWDADTMLFF